MNKIIGWLADRGGFTKVWAALDGKKTYAAAALGIVTSLAGLGAQFAPVLAAHNTAGLLTLLQALPSDPSWLSLVASFGLLGLGHKAEKAANATGEDPAPAAEKAAP